MLIWVKMCPLHASLDFLTFQNILPLKGTKPVLRSAKRAPANVRRLNNISDVIFYCSVDERSRALALLNAAPVLEENPFTHIYIYYTLL